ncbi:MAG: twin-arginine translocase TatA/TatE family subunit [Paracoccus sp.]|mgnify:FL=1|jgi:sec-independent protein translocase protein TatA|nr:twin-arginine translocase TatA/TatE family subunit [Paracoccus sp. (in: a-proteobacteria)]
MLNNIGLPGLLLIAVVVLVLFGRGKVSSLMGEVGKGITAFKKGVKDGAEEYDQAANEAKKPIANAPADDATRARAQADEALRDVTPRDGDRS